jgi:regulator of RNase E activity RraA
LVLACLPDNLQIFAKGTSTVGAGLSSVPYAINVRIVVEGVSITPGDVVFADPENGVVVIPQDVLEKVLEILPGLVEADRRAIEDVKAGVSVSEAFRRHRGK